MIKKHVNKILLCGFILSVALLLYHFNEFDFYYVKHPHWHVVWFAFFA